MRRVNHRLGQTLRHLSTTLTHKMASDFSPRVVGAANTLGPPLPPVPHPLRLRSGALRAEYRVFCDQGGQVLSFWHDIPLFATESKTTFNMVIEVPRWTNAKLEVRADLSSESSVLCHKSSSHTARGLVMMTDQQDGGLQPHPSVLFPFLVLQFSSCSSMSRVTHALAQSRTSRRANSGESSPSVLHLHKESLSRV